MSRCILGVAYGERYELQGNFMLESFLKHNPGWAVEKAYGNSIRVPINCMKDGISAFNACEIGRWVAIRELLDRYDEVLYCDNDMCWYDEYVHPDADVVLSPHYIDESVRINNRSVMYDAGIYNAGLIYMKSSKRAKEVCDFIINKVSGNPEAFIIHDKSNDSYGKMWLQGILSYVPGIWSGICIDGNPSNNVAFWNLYRRDRKLYAEDGRYVVEFKNEKTSLACFHFSAGSLGMINVINDDVANMLKDYLAGLKRKFDSENLIAMRADENFKRGILDLVKRNFGGKTGLTAIEIGSYQGESTELMLSTGCFDRIYCIDAWTNGYDDSDEASFSTNLAESAFDKRFENDPRVIKVKGFSYDVAGMIEDGIADLLYVDGCHQADAVKRDLEMYSCKIKEGGVISGHDYGPESRWRGTIEAVDEFLGHKPENTYDDFSWSDHDFKR